MPESHMIPEVLNLRSLAQNNPQHNPIVGTPFGIERLKAKRQLKLDKALWLLVLEGELIIDLPHGDFRILKRFDSLLIPAQQQVLLYPVEDSKHPVTVLSSQLNPIS
ncbi:MAG: hypothetical protein R2880_03680 [Deinococcales bacterium]